MHVVQRERRPVRDLVTLAKGTPHPRQQESAEEELLDQRREEDHHHYEREPAATRR